MPLPYSANVGLVLPPVATRNWDLLVNANMAALDVLAGVGQLCVIPAENPSSSLNIRVGAGSWRGPDGSVGSLAVPVTLGLPGGLTSRVWLDPGTGLVGTGSGFPDGHHVPLAIVTTGSGSVALVLDARVMAGSVRGSAGLVLPPMTSAARAAMTPVAGMLIWNTTTNAINAYDGISWRVVNLS